MSKLQQIEYTNTMKTNKNKFFNLLKWASQSSQEEEGKSHDHDDCTEKKTHQHKTVDVEEIQSGESPEENV